MKITTESIHRIIQSNQTGYTFHPQASMAISIARRYNQMGRYMANRCASKHNVNPALVRLARQLAAISN